jgi:hypothetical protein
MTTTHADVPAVVGSQAAPAQQGDWPSVHGAPGATHPGVLVATAAHTLPPEGPTQDFSQQSPFDPQGAPAGAQAAPQVKPPAPSGGQNPEQHCSGTAHAAAMAEQAAPGAPMHRSTPSPSARQPPRGRSQHSSSFMQRSPILRHMFGAHRIPASAAMHAPEQH